MLNRQKIAALTGPQKQNLIRSLEIYDKTEDAKELCVNVSRTGILFIPTCCGMSVQQQVDWVRYIINFDFKPPQ